MSTYVNVTMDNELATWVGSLSKFANGLTSLIDIEVLLVVGLASKLEYWWMLELATQSLRRRFMSFVGQQSLYSHGSFSRVCNGLFDDMVIVFFMKFLPVLALFLVEKATDTTGRD